MKKTLTILLIVLTTFIAMPLFAQDTGENWGESLELGASGEGDGFFEEYNDVLVVIMWILALIIAFIIVAVWKKGMNTAVEQTQAQAYVVSGSLKYNDKKDIFTNSKTTKTRKQSSSGSGVAAARRTTRKGGK